MSTSADLADWIGSAAFAFRGYNVTNLGPVLSYNQAFSPTTAAWLTPTAVLQPRFLKFSVQVDF